MGFGQALGDGMKAWQVEDTRQANMADVEADNARRDMLAGQTHEINKLNIEDARAKRAEWNNPEAVKARALNRKAELQKAQLTNQVYAGMNKMYSDQPVQQEVVNAVTETKQIVEDQGAQIKTTNFGTKFMTDIKDTGRFDDIKSFNAWKDTEPVIANMIKGPAVKYNPQDKDMKMQLGILAQREAKRSGEDPQVLLKGFEHLANQGLFVFDSVTGKPFDVMGIMSMTGVNKTLPKSLVTGANTRMNTDMTKSMTAQGRQTAQDAVTNATGSSAVKPVPGLSAVAPWHAGQKGDKRKLYNGKDPAMEASVRAAIGVPITPDLKEMIKFNEELAGQGGSGYWSGATPEQVQEGLENILDTFESGEGTDELMARGKAGVGMLETADMKNQYTKKLDFMADSNRVRNIFDSAVPADQGDINFMENVEADRVNNAGDKSDIGKTQTKVDDDMGLVKDLNSVMLEMQQVMADGGGGLLSGYLSDMFRTAAAKDPELIDKISKMTVGDTPEAKQEADKLRKTVLNSINQNSKMGMILASYIKSVSGAAVSDFEREFLTNILQGATEGSPKMMATAMQGFRDVLIQKTNRLVEKPYWQSMLPDTMYRARHDIEMEGGVDYASGMPEGQAVTRQVIDMAESGENTSEKSWLGEVWEGVKSKFGPDDKPDTSKPIMSSPKPIGSTAEFAKKYVD